MRWSLALVALASWLAVVAPGASAEGKHLGDEPGAVGSPPEAAASGPFSSRPWLLPAAGGAFLVAAGFLAMRVARRG